MGSRVTLVLGWNGPPPDWRTSPLKERLVDCDDIESSFNNYVQSKGRKVGNWVMVIEGTGQHHNGDDKDDADYLIKAYVKDLQRAGQRVHHASFTSGEQVYIDLEDENGT